MLTTGDFESAKKINYCRFFIWKAVIVEDGSQKFLGLGYKKITFAPLKNIYR
jgi:hypothetical protein